jgi:hypothetical protein
MHLKQTLHLELSIFPVRVAVVPPMTTCGWMAHVLQASIRTLIMHARLWLHINI